MFNSREYWQGVREVQATIASEFVLLMSLDNPLRGWVGGSTVEVKSELAARFIHDGSHRLATPAEIIQHQETEQRRKAATNGDAMKKAGLGVFILPAVKVKR
jgi:hypothetical protein